MNPIALDPSAKHPPSDVFRNKRFTIDDRMSGGNVPLALSDNQWKDTEVRTSNSSSISSSGAESIGFKDNSNFEH